MTLSLIEAKGFRALRYVRQPLLPFQVLVGPNASGKTTFLDVPAFMGQLLTSGLDAAVDERTHNFADLTWRREGAPIELAIEAQIPSALREQVGGDFTTVRYEICVAASDDGLVLKAERVSLQTDDAQAATRTSSVTFPSPVTPPATILPRKLAQTAKQVVNKTANGNDNFYGEKKSGIEFNPSFKLGPKKSALANLPADETRFPVATWLKGFLAENVQQIALNSLRLRHAAPPNAGRGFKPDGSNTPFVARALEQHDPERFRDWVLHLSTALPDLEGIRTVVRDDDKHAYLMLRYKDGLELPSWMVSDGTLRLLALTLPAYLRELRGVFLIEEPENGIHPRAIESVLQSLQSVYDAQILVATHSPVILASTKPSDLLCFAKDEDGATNIVCGDDHPRLKDWRSGTDLGVLFASGVLG